MTKLNIFAIQREWMKQHRQADSMIMNAEGEVIQAVYTSPLEQWSGRVSRDGIAMVPDMDYYNSLRDPALIEQAINEIFPHRGKEENE